MHSRRPQIQNRKHAYRNTLVPQVSAQNVTKLDPKCTSDGRHVNADLCLEDPFGNEAEVSQIGVVAVCSNIRNSLCCWNICYNVTFAIIP